MKHLKFALRNDPGVQDSAENTNENNENLSGTPGTEGQAEVTSEEEN